MKFTKQYIDVDKINEILAEIQQFIENREFFYDERSEKWQESEKGEEFQ